MIPIFSLPRSAPAISELLIWKRCESGPGRWREGSEGPSRWRGYWEGIVFRPRVEGEWTKKMGVRISEAEGSRWQRLQPGLGVSGRERLSQNKRHNCSAER